MHYPAILIGLMGDYIELGSAVFLAEGVYHSHPFTFKMNLDFYSHDRVLSLAKVFKAVKIAIRTIDKYHEVRKWSPPPENVAAHLFPSPTYLSGDPLPDGLVFKCQLSCTAVPFTVVKAGAEAGSPINADDISSGLYLASLPPSSVSPSESAPSTEPIEVLMKFTARYNVEAHRILYAAGYAPRLYSCSRVYGELYMVMMEYLREPWQTLWSWVEDRKLVPQSVWDDIAATLDILHSENIVFGDLRLPNIMCTEEDSSLHIKLVDFDWAGRDDEDRYPVMINHYLKDWAPGGGVEWYGVMHMSDDRAQLKHTKQLVRVRV